MRKVLGSPGCGKTHELLERLDAELRVVPPDRIAFVTFTRAAREEAVRRVRDRFGYGPTELLWFRTIHSAAYHLLGLEPGRVMTGDAWNEFAALHGYRFSDLPGEVDPDAAPAPLPRHAQDDELRYVCELAQNLGVSLSQALPRTRALKVSPGAVERFASNLEAYKASHGLLSFGDMLMRVLECGLRPAVEVAFIDEAQDLCPLQIAVVKSWFESCARVHVGGDDDQAIYDFQGASPDWLLNLAAADTKILVQSRRVPSAVHALAQRVIGRNSNRQPKVYAPRAAEGRVRHLSLERAIADVEGDVVTFVLARNRMSLSQFAKGLLERGLPFRVEGRGARCPLLDRPLVRAVEAAVLVAAGRPVTRPCLVDLLTYLAPELQPQGPLDSSLEWLMPADVRALGLHELVDALQQRAESPLDLLVKVNSGERRYLAGLVGRDGKFPVPKVTLTSIHGAKGRQAERVVVLPSMTKATYDEYQNGGQRGFEGENRVAYVGVTRTSDDLVIVHPRGQRRYDFPRLSGGSR